MATATSSNRPNALVPRDRIQVTKRQTRMAGMLKSPPLPSSGVDVIQAGMWMPMPDRKASKYPEIPMATTATMAVYSSNRSQPMNHPITSPRAT